MPLTCATSPHHPEPLPPLSQFSPQSADKVKSSSSEMLLDSQRDQFRTSSPHLSQGSTLSPLTLHSSGLNSCSSSPKFLLPLPLQPENELSRDRYKKEVFQQGRHASEDQEILLPSLQKSKILRRWRGERLPRRTFI